MSQYYYGLHFSPAVETVVKETTKNPKRMQRDAKKQMAEKGIGTKSQQALKLQQEQNKQERKEKSRKRKEAEASSYGLRILRFAILRDRCSA